MSDEVLYPQMQIRDEKVKHKRLYSVYFLFTWLIYLTCFVIFPMILFALMLFYFLHLFIDVCLLLHNFFPVNV